MFLERSPVFFLPFLFVFADTTFFPSHPGQKKLTVDQAVEYLGYGRFQYFLLIIVGVTQMAHSMEVMILSFLMPEVKSYWNISMWQVSLIGSSVFLGKLIGSLVWGNLSDKIGRRLGWLLLLSHLVL